MRRLATALILLPLIAGPLAGCSRSAADAAGRDGSGAGTSRTYPIAGFSTVELSGPDDVDIRIGSGYAVSAEGPADELARVRVRKDGDRLTIDRRDDSSSDGEGVTVHVTLPRLAAANVMGSGDMTVDRVAGAMFRGRVTGSGSLSLGSVAADAIELTSAGSGDIDAMGTVKTLAMAVSGSGDIDAGKLTASGATVSVSGSGSATAVVKGPASVRASGSGDVDLGPDARCTTSKTGSGDVDCGD